MANATTQGHGGTVQPGTRYWDPSILCDCGRSFHATPHPVEPDIYESPAWEAHVKDERAQAVARSR
jgi:hypothetical protein